MAGKKSCNTLKTKRCGKQKAAGKISPAALYDFYVPLFVFRKVFVECGSY